jgi:ArsR family transcriptional regulator
MKSVNCSDVLKVIADDTRLAVLRRLMNGPMRVGEINEKLKIDQSLLSHHLKILREAGLVIGTRDGKAVLYRLAPGVEPKKRRKAINIGCCQLSFDSKEK